MNSATVHRGCTEAGPPLSDVRAPFARITALHSLGWLAAANVVGVWLAVSLLWPAAGNRLAPLTWGRWAAVHMNWQLYGWCALPLVAALMAWYFGSGPARDDGDAESVGRPASRRDAHLALTAWTLALVAGGLRWLGGSVSGKLFLDWHGWTRLALPVAMTVLWVQLARHWRARWTTMGRDQPLAGARSHPPLAGARRHLAASASEGLSERWLQAGVLGGLALVPPVLIWATSRSMYHPVNPDSGGATGAAVLASVLGIIAVLFLLPRLLGVPATARRAPFWWALGASWLVFAALDRGHVSHHSPTAIAGLGTLLLWIPLLPLYWQRHAWPEAARPWLRAAVIWWTVLIITGWISFLPGVSEALKFTHALVGHAHLAMAGLITSVNAAILVTVLRRTSGRAVFWLWQAGCVAYVSSMLALGVGEALHPAALFRGEDWTQGLLYVRLVAGLAMTTGSVRWLVRTIRS